MTTVMVHQSKHPHVLTHRNPHLGLGISVHHPPPRSPPTLAIRYRLIDIASELCASRPSLQTIKIAQCLRYRLDGRIEHSHLLAIDILLDRFWGNDADTMMVTMAHTDENWRYRT